MILRVLLLEREVLVDRVRGEEEFCSGLSFGFEFLEGGEMTGHVGGEDAFNQEPFGALAEARVFDGGDEVGVRVVEDGEECGDVHVLEDALVAVVDGALGLDFDLVHVVIAAMVEVVGYCSEEKTEDVEIGENGFDSI